MSFLSQERARGKTHARFSQYSTSTDDIQPDVEENAVVDADDDSIPFTDARQFIEEYGPLVERKMVLWSIFSLAQNNKNRGRGLYAFPSYQFLAERLFGDRSPKGAARIKRHIPYYEKLGLLIVQRRRPSKDGHRQTNIYIPTRKCFDFIDKVVRFAMDGVFLGGNVTRDEKAPLVLKEEYIERASLVDEKRLSSSQEQEIEQEMPSVSAIADDAGAEEKEEGKEKGKRQGNDSSKAISLDLMRNARASTHQASEIYTQVSKLVKQHPERTRLLRVKVKEQERDGTSRNTILEALAVTEAKEPGDYAAYFKTTCAKLKHAEDESEAANRRVQASIQARNDKYARWDKEWKESNDRNPNKVKITDLFRQMIEEKAIASSSTMHATGA